MILSSSLSSANTKAVIFDLGKVLVDFDYTITARRLLARATCTRDDLLRMINQSPLLAQFERGDLSNEAFFAEVKQASGYAGTFDEFADMFGDIFTAIPEMVELHAQVLARGYPTFIFSNTNDLAVRHIRKAFPFFSRFTGYIYSYEHHALKPERRLYEVVEQVSGKTGGDLVYIDDRPENIEAAKVRGWQGLVHESPAQTRRALGAMGVLRASLA